MKTNTDIESARARLDEAEAKLREAQREHYRADLALREADGRENEAHTRWLRATLAGDEAAAHEARVLGAAEGIRKYGPEWLKLDIADEARALAARLGEAH